MAKSIDIDSTGATCLSISKVFGCLPFYKAMLRKKDSVPPGEVMLAYAVFLPCAVCMYRLIARGAFSSLLTLSAMLQCLAILLLTLQVLCHRSAAGISVRALCMDGMAFAFRLSSTVWLNGYLPADVTGDWIYQTIDMCSLGMTLFLIHHVLTTRVTTYNKE